MQEGKPEYPEKTCGSKYGLETKCKYGAGTGNQTRAHWCITTCFPLPHSSETTSVERGIMKHMDKQVCRIQYGSTPKVPILLGASEIDTLISRKQGGFKQNREVLKLQATSMAQKLTRNRKVAKFGHQNGQKYLQNREPPSEMGGG